MITRYIGMILYPTKEGLMACPQMKWRYCFSPVTDHAKKIPRAWSFIICRFMKNFYWMIKFLCASHVFLGLALYMLPLHKCMGMCWHKTNFTTAKASYLVEKFFFILIQETPHWAILHILGSTYLFDWGLIHKFPGFGVIIVRKKIYTTMFQLVFIGINLNMQVSN